MTHTECNFCTRQKIGILAKAWEAQVVEEPLEMPADLRGILAGSDPVAIKLRYKSGELVWIADLMTVTPHCVCGQNWNAETQQRDAHLKWCKLRALQCLESNDIATAFTSLASDLNKHDHTRGHEAIRIGFGMLASGRLNTPAKFRDFVESVR